MAGHRTFWMLTFLLHQIMKADISFGSWQGVCSLSPTICVSSLNFKSTEFLSYKPGYTGWSIGPQLLLAQDILHVFVRELVRKCIQGNV